MKSTFDLQNPWRFPGYQFQQDPYIKRNIFIDLFNEHKKKRITVVLGARQVGKTFLIKKIGNRPQAAIRGYFYSFTWQSKNRKGYKAQ